MEFVTVTFDRVFEVRRFPFRRAFTEFSFQCGSLKKYAVHVPGSPRIEAGMTVTALLKDPGNWRTIQGWKNWSTGELALPQRGTSFTVAFFGVLMGPLFLFLSLEDSPAKTFTLVFGTLAALLGVHGIFLLFQESSIVKRLRGLREPPFLAGVPNET